MSARFLLAVMVVALAGLAADAADDPKALAAEARTILKASCHRCHNGEGSSSGYAFDVTRHETLVKPLDGEEPVVVPNSIEKSPLGKAVQKRMPQKGSPERDAFTDEQRQVIHKWIVAGAPPFPTGERPFIALKTVLTSIRNHLNQADRDVRPYLRYFSLAHVHNNPEVLDEDLRYHRAALSKVVNSLSWKGRIVVPEAIDKTGTVFVVDVRDLDWDRDGLWKRVIEAYPYGLRYGSHPDRDLRELDREITDLAKSELPWVRADWFVATASRPPLYHDLLQLPHNARLLEKRLDVNMAENFLKGKLARAGFPKSGVSGQNRMVERHDAATGGAYWKSYDFLPDNGLANLTRFPLGPRDLGDNTKHPYPAQAFKHDGGEIVFHLPNGLQGYLLVNSKDDRIDAGPITVVNDDQRISGTPEIVTGVSCMACHIHGMIPFKDRLRDHSAVFGDAESKVRLLYKEQKQMDDLVDVDRKKFLVALEKAIGPFLRIEGDKDTPLIRFKEPVALVAGPYRRGFLDMKALTLEFFLEKPEEVQKIGAGRLKELGLEMLTKPGGLVARLQWEASDGFSLMQEVARELRFTPFGR
jgi:mono/diheme cytochrome c family protein